MNLLKQMKWALLMGLILFAACTTAPKNEYTINGKIDDKQFNGKKVYLRNDENGEFLDSTVINNGTFIFKNEIDSNFIFALLTTEKVGENAYFTRCVLEPGIISLNIINDSLSGTPLNDAYFIFHNKSIELQNSSLDLLNAIYKTTDIDEKNKIWEQFFESENLRYEYINEFYNANKNNILGALAMSDLLRKCGTFAEMDSVLNGASDIVVNNAWIKDILTNQETHEKAIEQTLPGKHYTDIDVIDYTTGKITKLSNIIEGKVTLIDFWASWCNPCRKEIPVIADVYKKYADKGLTVVGLNVWDKDSERAKTVTDMNMTWIQLMDTTKNATEKYAVEGIPQIILINANGIIIKRDLRGNAIEEAVVAVLNEKK